MEWKIAYKNERQAMKEIGKWPPLYRSAFFQLLGLLKKYGGRAVPNVKIAPLRGKLKFLMKAYLKKKYRIIYAIDDDQKEICIHDLGTRQGIYK